MTPSWTDLVFLTVPASALRTPLPIDTLYSNLQVLKMLQWTPGQAGWSEGGKEKKTKEKLGCQLVLFVEDRRGGFEDELGVEKSGLSMLSLDLEGGGKGPAMM